MIEERIVARLDLVEEDVVDEAIEAPGHVGADEVHAVAAARQREADLGGDDAAAAEGRVAGDADAAEAARS